MRVNNNKISQPIQILYSVFILSILLGLLFLVIPIAPINDKISAPMFIAIGIVGFILIRLFGNQKFEYDSDGEALNFKSSDVFLSKYSKSFIKISDFPKSKLLSYKITGTITKTLHLIITSKRTASGTTKIKYNVTFLGAKNLKDLKRSLGKIVKHNKMMRDNEERKQQLKPENA